MNMVLCCWVSVKEIWAQVQGSALLRLLDFNQVIPLAWASFPSCKVMLLTPVWGNFSHLWIRTVILIWKSGGIFSFNFSTSKEQISNRFHFISSFQPTQAVNDKIRIQVWLPLLFPPFLTWVGIYCQQLRQR